MTVPPDPASSRSEPGERQRILVGTAAAVLVVSAIVLVIRQALPVIPGWAFPVVLVVVTGALLAWGRRLAARGKLPTARVVAAWAGVVVSVALSALANLVEIGGGLLVVLPAILVANAGIALWFRSSIHFALIQWGAFAWGVLAHLFGVLPVGAVVVALAGIWWTSTVGLSRLVVVTTTLLVPLSGALALHPLTHDGVAVDGADVATAAGLTALAVLIGARIVDRPAYESLWPIMRATAAVALLVQIALGGIPAAETLLAPDRPWAGILLGAALFCAAVCVALLSRLRPRTHRVLEYCGLMIAVVVVTVVFGGSAGTGAAVLALSVPAAVDLVRGHPAGRPSAVRLIGVVLPSVVALVLVPLPLPVIVVALVVLAGVVLLLGRPRRTAEVAR